MKRISIWTIRYSFDTLRNRSIENPVPFYPLRNTYKNYPFQTDNQTDNKLPRRAKSLKDDMAKKTLSKPKFSLRKCSLWESMSSNDPWLNPFLDPVENLRGDVQKKNSIFKDIIQIEVDPLPPTLILTNLFLTKCWSCWPPSLP